MGTSGRSAADQWIDRRAVDRRGNVVGVVVDVYDDGASLRPAWLAITTGYFGVRVVVAPLRGASCVGGDVVVAHDHQTITSAPTVDTFVAVVPRQHERLLAHYGLEAAPSAVRQPKSRGVTS